MNGVSQGKTSPLPAVSIFSATASPQPARSSGGMARRLTVALLKPITAPPAVCPYCGLNEVSTSVLSQTPASTAFAYRFVWSSEVA